MSRFTAGDRVAVFVGHDEIGSKVFRNGTVTEAYPTAGFDLDGNYQQTFVYDVTLDNGETRRRAQYVTEELGR